MSDFEDSLELVSAAIATLPQTLQDVAARLETPIFHSACSAGELDLVRGLLDAGLAPDMYPCTEDEDDEPALTWIARYRDTSSQGALNVAALLIERDAGVDDGLPLLAALEANDLPLMRMLLAAGADPVLVLDEATPDQTKLLRLLISTQ